MSQPAQAPWPPLNGFHYRFEPIAGATRTLLLLHGTGGNENDLLGLGRQLDPRANLLSPRGRALENGMPRFFRRLSEGVFDLDDLRLRTAELAAFIRVACENHHLNLNAITGLGFSNGANIAASLLLLSPAVLNAAALLRPMVPLIPDPLPNLAGTRVLIAAGDQDAMVSPSQTQALSKLLTDCGAEVEVNTAHAGHGLTTADITAVEQWLKH